MIFKNIWSYELWVLCFTLPPDRCRTTRICHRFLAAPVCLTNETPTILLHCLPLFSPAFLLFGDPRLGQSLPWALRFYSYDPTSHLLSSQNLKVTSQFKFLCLPNKNSHLSNIPGKGILLSFCWQIGCSYMLYSMRYVFMHAALDTHCLFCAFLFAWKNLDEDRIYHISTCLQHVSTPTSGISNL